MKKAFTLIELLVVIAIIAILAAILFPVFAQAKAAAKKTTTISNTKQELTSIAIYQGDVDDLEPMGMGVRPDGDTRWGVGVIHPVPYNVVTTAPWQQTQRFTMAQSFWANATAPYSKNFGILTVSVAPNVNNVPDTFLSGVTPANVGLTYNGLLHTMNASSLNAPANVPMLWNDQKLNYIGRGLSSPALYCISDVSPTGQQGNPTPCTFNGSGFPSPSAQANGTGGAFYIFDFTTTTWVFDKRMVVGYCDGHAKSAPVGVTVAPNVASPFGAISDPEASVSTTGAPISYWPCGVNGPSDLGSTANYPCYFRPDRTW